MFTMNVHVIVEYFLPLMGGSFLQECMPMATIIRLARKGRQMIRYCVAKGRLILQFQCHQDLQSLKIRQQHSLANGTLSSELHLRDIVKPRQSTCLSSKSCFTWLDFWWWYDKKFVLVLLKLQAALISVGNSQPPRGNSPRGAMLFTNQWSHLCCYIVGTHSMQALWCCFWAAKRFLLWQQPYPKQH